jgi:hypothetical protein
MVAGRPRKPIHREQEPGDEQVGGWPRDRLVSMDEKFCRAVERAIERGTERAPSSTIDQR